MVSSILSKWQQAFPACEPVAHHLRLVFPSRWVRFHSLPSSKRYPEDDADYAIVLQRHNRLLGELAQQGETIAVLTTGYSGTPEAVRSEADLLELVPQAIPWRSIAMHAVDNNFADPSYWHVFVSLHHWTTGHLNSLILKTADEVLANVMIVDLDCKWLLHPYDGGMDVILESTEARDRLKACFPSWLSGREDGL